MMANMNQEILEKNLAYQKDIEEVARMLFHAFYYDEQERAAYPPDSDQYEKNHLDELYAKAEKILRFFPNVQEAKRSLKFLNEINHVKGLEIVHSL
jgi:hypothetical protein